MAKVLCAEKLMKQKVLAGSDKNCSGSVSEQGEYKIKNPYHLPREITLYRLRVTYACTYNYFM